MQSVEGLDQRISVSLPWSPSVWTSVTNGLARSTTPDTSGRQHRDHRGRDVQVDRLGHPCRWPRGESAQSIGRTTPSTQPESELRALIAVAAAVAAAHRLEDVLEVVAEETCRVVGASSVAFSYCGGELGAARPARR